MNILLLIAILKVCSVCNEDIPIDAESCSCCGAAQSNEFGEEYENE